MGDILLLTHRLPYPPDRGDRIRSWHLLKALAGMGRVHLAAFADGPSEIAHIATLRALVGRCHIEQRARSMASAGLAALRTGGPVSLAAFDSDTMRTAVARMLAEKPIDTIVAFSGQMAQFVPQNIAARFVMDFVDVDSAKFEAYAARGGFAQRWLFTREAARLAAFERETALRADVSLFVSEVEAALFRRRSGLGPDRVVALENGIDLAFFDPAEPYPPPEKRCGPLIVFTGQMDYRPNIEAASEFAAKTLPAIRDALPGVRFAVVGRDPARRVCRLSNLPGVIVTGAVPDVRPWLAAADVVVAPLAIARGVQNKVLEAMAMARPVVASPAAFEGIAAEPDRDLIVAAQPEQAAAVITLLRDPDRAAILGQNARRRIEAHYGWEARLAPLARLLGREPARETVAA